MTQAELPLILAVDDERPNLMLLERVLRRQFRVISVTNVQTALDTLLQAPFDLILLDIMMPEIDGLKALEMIRHNPKTADIPIILISALSDGQNVSRGLEAGANDYIGKPIDTEATLARVRTQIALKKLQDERKQTIAELEAAQQMKDRLLRMASHDLKSPLMNIRLATMLLETDADCMPDGLNLLGSVQASVDKMENVIKDFLDTAAVQTGALDLHMESIELEPLITGVLVEHQPHALRKNITLKRGDTGGVITADKARFQQALANLVSNAVKYSPADTQVTVGTTADGDHVIISVADQGPGIPAAEHNKLFTQFGKLSPRPTAGESSTGLGLWIVKHLVTLQGGEVGLDSPAEGGSVFWIRMPCPGAQENEPTTPA